MCGQSSEKYKQQEPGGFSTQRYQINLIVYHFFPLSPPPPCSAFHYVRRRRRWRIRLTDFAGFLLILPPSVLLAIPLSTHPCPLQRESSCVSLSVSRGAAGKWGKSHIVSHVTNTQPSSSPPPSAPSPGTLSFYASPSISFFVSLFPPSAQLRL